MARIKNILFDWCGTLVDDLPAVWRATNVVLHKAGVPEVSLDEYRAEFELPFKRFYDRYTPGVPMEQLEAWYHPAFHAEQDSIKALPHSQGFLEYCKGRELRMFVLSSIHHEHFEQHCRITGFETFMERCYVDIRDKTESIHGVLKENHLDPRETLFIGDMQHDIVAARHGGVHSAAVLTGFNRSDQLRAAKPDLMVEHLDELKEILQEADLDFAPQRTNHGVPLPIVTVGGLIFNERDEVLMVRTHKWSNMWGIPGGKTKLHERSEDALLRELKEETDLNVSEIEFVLVQDCIQSTEFYRDAHFVLLNYTCRVSGEPQVVLNEEAQEFVWLPLEKTLKLPLNAPTKVLIDAVMQKREGAMAK